MNKKIIIPAFVILLLIVGGVFWWQKREIKGSPEDYVIKETEQGKIVENKKAGLVVNVPEDWEVKKMGIEDGLEEGAVVFYSSNSNIERELQEEKKVLPLEKGCLIHFKLIYEKLNFNEIKTEAMYSNSMWGLETEEFKEVTINNYRALKNIFNTRATGSGIGIYIPKNNKVYWINLFWSFNEKEICSQEFDKFLETV